MQISPTLSSIGDQLDRFAAERNWQDFHTPKNLSMALSVEAAELMEIFQWLPNGERSELTLEQLEHVQQEAADVLIYLLMLAHRLDFDILKAAQEKINLNAQKYPAPGN